MRRATGQRRKSRSPRQQLRGWPAGARVDHGQLPATPRSTVPARTSPPTPVGPAGTLAAAAVAPRLGASAAPRATGPAELRHRPSPAAAPPAHLLRRAAERGQVLVLQPADEHRVALPIHGPTLPHTSPRRAASRLRGPRAGLCSQRLQEKSFVFKWVDLPLWPHLLHRTRLPARRGRYLH